jgi:hypothetical protein
VEIFPYNKYFIEVMKRLYTLLLLLLSFSLSIPAQEGIMLIDDFSTTTSRLGTRWEGFTDRVMGGRSDMSAYLLKEENVEFVRMTGTVSLENNGGFIQVRLPLVNRGSYDASEYKGIEITVRAKPGTYYIHLRNSNTMFPWQYYKSDLDIREEWTTIRIPWSEFGSGDYGRMRELRVDKLKSIAIVAGLTEFEAQIDVANISFY